MPQVDNGGAGANQPPRKSILELSTEVRLLLALVLTGLVWVGTSYYYQGTAPARPPAKKTSPAPPAGRPASTPAAETVAPPSAPVAAQTEQTYILDTALYRVTFTNRGARVRSWLLKKYRDNRGNPLELVNTASGVERPFALHFKNQKPAADLDNALFLAKPEPDGRGVIYEYSNGAVFVRKSFRFRRDSYQSQVTTEVMENGRPVPHSIAWRGGFGDLALSNAAGSVYTVYWDVGESELVKKDAGEAKNGPVSFSGNFSFAGVEDTYFAAVFLPGNGNLEVISFSDSVPTAVDKTPQNFAGAAVSGGGGRNDFALFVGPKDLDILRSVDPKLESLVDFGWFSFLAKPLFLIVNWVTEQIVHSYGWAIVLVTVVLNFLLFPLKISSMKSMKKMQALQPQIQAINERYKNVGLRDPRKQQQNQEVMELYKRHGVNPAGGCMPILLQIPFFIAFYKVFSVSIEMRGASWLWVPDLSQAEPWPIKALPLAMILSQFIMQKMTPTTTADPAQQRMMLFMPVVFGFMFYYLPSGLVLYYLTSNLVSIGQQWFFNRTSVAEALARSVQPPKKKSGKK